MMHVFPRQGHSKGPVTIPDQFRPFISVIVPVRNEEGFIQRILEELLGQKYDLERFEVIVVDGQSTDATCEIVRELQQDHANLELSINPRCWSSAARNMGIRDARGEIVVIVDGHCVLDNRNYLQDLADAFTRSGADCVGRPQPLEVPEASTLQRAIAAARSSPLGHNPASYIYASREGFVCPQSVAVAYRRSVFDEVGFFDESFDACEDVEFNHRVDRAGLTCFFTPRIQVRYFPRTTLSELFRQMARYGRGRVRLLCKHLDTFTLPCFLPALLVLGVMMGPVLSCFMPALLFVYLATICLYATAVLAESLSITWKKKDAGLLPWLPLAFIAIHCGAGTGTLQEATTRFWRYMQVERQAM